jgi:hypothetical protein
MTDDDSRPPVLHARRAPEGAVRTLVERRPPANTFALSPRAYVGGVLVAITCAALEARRTLAPGLQLALVLAAPVLSWMAMLALAKRARRSPRGRPDRQPGNVAPAARGAADGARPAPSWSDGPGPVRTR